MVIPRDNEDKKMEKKEVSGSMDDQQASTSNQQMILLNDNLAKQPLVDWTKIRRRIGLPSPVEEQASPVMFGQIFVEGGNYIEEEHLQKLIDYAAMLKAIPKKDQTQEQIEWLFDYQKYIGEARKALDAVEVRVRHRPDP